MTWKSKVATWPALLGLVEYQFLEVENPESFQPGGRLTVLFLFLLYFLRHGKCAPNSSH